MTDPGYRDSPNTVDGPATGREPVVDADPDTTLTTDDEAQREDSVARPGNEPD